MSDHNNPKKKSKYFQSTLIENLNSIKDNNKCMQDIFFGYSGDYDELIKSSIFFNFNDVDDLNEENLSKIRFTDEWSEIFIIATKDEPIDNEYNESIFHNETIYINDNGFCYIPLETSTNIRARNIFDKYESYELFCNVETHCEKNASTIKLYLNLCLKPFLTFKHPSFNYINIDYNLSEPSIDMIDVKEKKIIDKTIDDYLNIKKESFAKPYIAIKIVTKKKSIDDKRALHSKVIVDYLGNIKKRGE